MRDSNPSTWSTAWAASGDASRSAKRSTARASKPRSRAACSRYTCRKPSAPARVVSRCRQAEGGRVDAALVSGFGVPPGTRTLPIFDQHERDQLGDVGVLERDAAPRPSTSQDPERMSASPVGLEIDAMPRQCYKEDRSGTVSA